MAGLLQEIATNKMYEHVPSGFELAKLRCDLLQPLLNGCSAAVKPSDTPDAITADPAQAMLWDAVFSTPVASLKDFAVLLVPVIMPEDGKHTWESMATCPAFAMYVYDAEGNEGGRARLLTAGRIITVQGYTFHDDWQVFHVGDSVNPALPANALVLSKHLVSSLHNDLQLGIMSCKQALVEERAPPAPRSSSAMNEEVLGEIRDLKDKLTALQDAMRKSDLKDQLTALQDAMERSEIRKLRKELDCWHSNARTRVESTTFKDALIEFYHCAADDGRVKCMATGRDYPRHEVRASHIMKRSTNGDTLALFGLPVHLDHPRNGMLLLEPIEQAFDRKDVCILYSPVTRQLTLKVLNPQLHELKMTSEQGTIYGTYGSIDGAVLHLPEGKVPYRRILSMHAKFAFSRALNFGWVENTEVLESYFNVSDAGLEESLGLGHLTWQQVHSDIHTTALVV